MFHKGKAGETYCVGADNEQANLNLAKQICQLLDQEKPRKNGRSYSELLTFVTDRPGHDLRYAIDSSKLKNELGWKQHRSFEENLKKTIQWYLPK